MTLSKNSALTEKSNDQDKHQQQILFDEDLTEQSASELLNSQQLVFDNQDYLPIVQKVSASTDSQLDELTSNENKKPRWIWRIIFVLFTVLIGIEAFSFFSTGFVESPIITSIYAAILTCLSFVAGASVLREFTGLRQFKQQQKVKAQAQTLFLDNSAGEQATIKTKKFCENISRNLPCDLVSEQEKPWADALAGEHTQAELLQLYSRIVLTKVDEKALAEVAKFSTEATVLVALSPVAIIDMLIMLWRNLRMINKVAGLYGLKLGYWSRIKLIKQVFVNMAYAGASELIADFGTEMIGADLLGKVSGRLAQGLGAGMLTARLGLKTIQLCRPLPFNENPPRLGQVRKQIVNKIKGLIKDK